MSKLALILAVLLVLPLSARNQPKSPSVDADYVSALATANKFLQAWQSHDKETAALLLSDHARGHTSADALSSFFSTRSEQAYELFPGRKLAPGRYEFPIALYSAPEPNHWTHPRTSTLRLIHAPNSDWIVDNLP